MVKEKLVNIIMIIFLIFSVSFINGCAPNIIDKVQIQQIELEETPPFVPPIEIPKPEKPIPIFLDGDFNVTDKSETLVYFAFNKEEFVKIIQLTQAFDVLDQLSYLYVGMINAEIETNNDLKEALGRKDVISQHFADLYVNEQNMRLQEGHQNEKAKLFDRIVMVIQTGVILALIL